MRAALIGLLLLLAAPVTAAPPVSPDPVSQLPGDTPPPTDPALLAPPPQDQPVVQNRLHRLRWELSLGLALLPADAFTKEAGLTGSLTYHFNDLVAWEAAHVHLYATDPSHPLYWESSQRTQLEQSIGIAPQRFTARLYQVDSNFVISPVYAKLSLLGRHVLYLQLFALGGVGMGLITGGDPPGGSTDPGRGLRPAVLVDLGVGLRVWVSHRVSLRYDLRQYAEIDTAVAHASWPLYMSLAASINFDGGQGTGGRK